MHDHNGKNWTKYEEFAQHAAFFHDNFFSFYMIFSSYATGTTKRHTEGTGHSQVHQK